MSTPKLPQSRFSPLLHTNYAATEAELPEVHRWCEERLAEIGTLTGEITQLQNRLRPLIERRDALQTAVNSHVALASPFRRILPEILAIIFRFCLPDGRPSIMQCNEAPVLLGRVCSHWRAIALGTPALWCAVHLPIPTSRRAAGHELIVARFDAFRSWLERSGSLPLHISIMPAEYVSADCEEEFLHSFHTAIDILSPHFDRHHILTVGGSPASWSVLSELFGNGRLPVLTELELAGGDAFYRNATTDDIIWTSMSGGPPSLTSLTLRDIYGLSSIALMTYLTRLDIEYTNKIYDSNWLPDTLLALSRCDKLRELAISADGYYHYSATTAPNQVCLPRLHSLTLGVRQDYAKAFLQLLVCPHLESFSLRYYGEWDGDAPEHELLGSLTRAFLLNARDQPVTFLSLPHFLPTLGDEPERDTSCLVRCLESCPYLESLHLSLDIEGWGYPHYQDRWMEIMEVLENHLPATVKSIVLRHRHVHIEDLPRVRQLLQAKRGTLNFLCIGIWEPISEWGPPHISPAIGEEEIARMKNEFGLDLQVNLTAKPSQDPEHADLVLSPWAGFPHRSRNPYQVQ